MCGIFYVFSWLHLLFNLLVQVLVGLPLEMVHGSLRIGVVYMAGVLAGETRSLCHVTCWGLIHLSLVLQILQEL